jgi:predicted lipoprotein with Yx(FWY)xxD motif
MKTPSTGLIAVLGASALMVAGCGSSSKTPSATAGASATPTASTQSSTAAATTTRASGASVAVAVKHSKLGVILAAGPKKMTVYMFEGDKGSTSSCSGACASVWPPVTTSGSPTAAAGASSANLGTITRPDGTTQVTYKGHPLYHYASDKDSGDAYGQGVKGFGSDWYVIAPSGSKIDKS